MQLNTVVMIVVPHEVQAIAVPILRQYAPETLIRVPAHITVLFPFVPAEQLDDTANKLYQVCESIPPFEITLDGYDSFPGFTFMRLVNPEPVRALFRTLFKEFPDYPPYGGRFGNELNPHLTVAEFASEAKQGEATMPPYKAITFTTTHLHLMYGYSGIALPFLTHSVIPLQG
jgi:2'-5' RNA ligase